VGQGEESKARQVKLARQAIESQYRSGSAGDGEGRAVLAALYCAVLCYDTKRCDVCEMSKVCVVSSNNSRKW
jgi:hypothetical protein